jgi:hypothetical protein
MKKTIIAVFAVLAVASVAGAQEAAWNFDGRGAAALPVPKLERVRTEGDIQPDISDSIIPQRIVVLENMDRAQFRKMLEKAVRRNNTKSVECYLTGDITVGNMICGSECCVDSEIGSASSDCHMIGPCIAAPLPDEDASKAVRKPSFLEDCVFSCSSSEDGCLNFCRTLWQPDFDNCKGENCAEQAKAGLEKCEGMCFTGAGQCLKGCFDSKRPARTKGR